MAVVALPPPYLLYLAKYSTICDLLGNLKVGDLGGMQQVWQLVALPFPYLEFKVPTTSGRSFLQ